MKANVRYSNSLFAAAITTFFTFLGMSFLIDTPSSQVHTSIEFADFSKIRDMKQPNIKKEEIKQPPKRVATTKPPATPKLDITSDLSNRNTLINTGLLDSKIENISDSINTNILDHNREFEKSSGLVAKFITSPVYPIKASQNKIEGYVTVEFTVNELGQVVDVSVIDSQPKRIFNDAAKRAILKSKFRPMLLNGVAQNTRATQTFEFKLTD